MKKIPLLSYIFFTVLCSIITQAHAAIKSIDEFTTQMNHFPGYYSFFYDTQNGKVYLKVDKFEQPFLLQQSLPYGIGSNDIGLDRGQLGNTHLVKFERFGDKVMLRAVNTYYRANTQNKAEQQSIKEAFASSILAGFKVVAEDQSTALIDYTPYLLSDVHGVSRTLAARKQGNFNLDESRSAVYMARSKAFVKNTELEAVLTFKGTKPGEFVRQVSADPYAITVHMHHSLIELPDDNYTPRQFNPQSGFWSIEHKDYAAPLGESMFVRYIPRHRLAKKDPSLPISEPVEPIVYYLDPGVPEPVKSALLEGGKWWNDAFSAAGYKNAFIVKVLPTNVDPMDIRYNVIQWVHRATRGWSYGSSVIDPRTGEILKGHVTLGSLRVRQDILIAEALAAPYLKGDEVAKNLHAMALDRIRQLSAHEIGHTLGIAHNFAASVNDRASVMDYPHPLLSFNEQGRLDVTRGYATGMGIWDTQVIKYGYSDFTHQDESAELAEILKENKAKGLAFISDSDARAKGGAHPTAHLWDNGANPSEELLRVLDVRKKALSQFGLNNIKSGVALSQLEEKLVPLYLFHRFQVESAVKLIAGVHYEYETRGNEPAQGAKVVDKQVQQAAVNAILATLTASNLVIPESVLSLIPPKAYGESKTRESIVGRTGLTLDAMALPEVAVQHSLSLLLNPQRLNRLAQQQARNNQFYSLDVLLKQLYSHVYNVSAPDTMKGKITQRIQFLTAKTFADLVANNNVSPEVQAQLRYYLVKLSEDFNQNTMLSNTSTGESAFKQYLAMHVKHFLANGEWPNNFKVLPIPPGSPI
ncbi:MULTISPECIES: zinc-dependent metalloprotease [unclassified Pseudoalteromonas]|uniref:zinc-dependent metalloprotease n=1 Tax=unclassified Pseudoalteromonas TaxID=194690 RepID=UPI001109490D|nr:MULTISPECIES: zinc-dependent metalloprotease [unclassified Pseudoalteromonas]TMN84924.1 peptidase [Pseudoalteromonas sp. S410]TMN88507.1 peptidase [Pseudoalteromonas sp. S408]TMN96844.1 peptidase [Pseudoalteromonas sp. S407]TMN98512.1 peptidase [Pseudoalteromonas sp. S409]TMO06389.1 peptidase [Pseudoalteromonas sp. S186]